jgi:hypothetical protein
MTESKTSTSFRLTNEVQLLIQKLATRLGMGKADVVAIAVREKANAMGIAVTEAELDEMLKTGPEAA